MRLQWKFEGRNKYLYSKLTGQYSYNQLVEYIHDADNELAKRGLSKLLINMQDMSGHAPTMDQYNIGQVVATLKIHARAAAVLSNETPDRFVVTVARNNGAFMDVFTDEASGIEWLFSDK